MTISVLSIAISGITPADQGAMAEAARITASSSRPRPPMGLAMESQRRAASAIAP